MDNFGRPMRLDNNFTKQQLADAGFLDIKEEVIRLPLRLRRWFNLGMQQVCQPLCLAPLGRGHGRTRDQLRDLSEKVRIELYGNAVHAYCTL